MPASGNDGVATRASDKDPLVVTPLSFAKVDTGIASEELRPRRRLLPRTAKGSSEKLKAPLSDRSCRRLRGVSLFGVLPRPKLYCLFGATS